MKQKSVYLCSDCGYESPKWFGKCPSCGAWNTMSEFKIQPESAARGTNSFPRGASRPVPLSEIESGDEARFHSGIGELDRVLGGGAVHGSFVLVGGEPGIGKSTLLLQMCQEMCRNAKVLYVSGEESLRQIKLRAARLQISSPELYILSETDMEMCIRDRHRGNDFHVPARDGDSEARFFRGFADRLADRAGNQQQLFKMCIRDRAG